MAFEDLYKKMKAVGTANEDVDTQGRDREEASKSHPTAGREEFKGQISAEEDERREKLLQRLEATLREEISDGFHYVFDGEEQSAYFRGPALARDIKLMVQRVLEDEDLYSFGSFSVKPLPGGEPDAEKSGYQGGRGAPEPEPGVDRRDFLTSADRRRKEK